MDHSHIVRTNESKPIMSFTSGIFTTSESETTKPVVYNFTGSYSAYSELTATNGRLPGDNPADSRSINEQKLTDIIKEQEVIDQKDRAERESRSGRLDSPSGKYEYVEYHSSPEVPIRAESIYYYKEAIPYNDKVEKRLKFDNKDEENAYIANTFLRVAHERITSAKSNGTRFPGGEDVIVDNLYSISCLNCELIKLIMKIKDKPGFASVYNNVIRDIEPVIDGSKIIVGYDFARDNILKWVGYSTRLEEISAFSKEVTGTLASRSIFTIGDLARELRNKLELLKINYLLDIGVGGINDARTLVETIDRVRSLAQNPNLRDLPDISDVAMKALTSKSIVTMDDVRTITKNNTNRAECITLIRDATGLKVEDARNLTDILIKHCLFDYTVAIRSTQPDRTSASANKSATARPKTPPRPKKPSR